MAGAAFGDGTPGSIPCSKVELSVSCSSLPNKSDAICVLYTKPNTGDSEWVKYGMTEMISDSSNPKVCTTYRRNARRAGCEALVVLHDA